MYLKLSHLETGFQRNSTEIARAEARILALRDQLEEIIREQNSLKAAMQHSDRQEPTSAPAVEGVARPVTDHVAAPERIGLSVRY